MKAGLLDVVMGEVDLTITGVGEVDLTITGVGVEPEVSVVVGLEITGVVLEVSVVAVVVLPLQHLVSNQARPLALAAALAAGAAAAAEALEQVSTLNNNLLRLQKPFFVFLSIQIMKLTIHLRQVRVPAQVTLQEAVESHFLSLVPTKELLV
jgi:hypothetical protein